MASRMASTWPWGKVFCVESRSWGETRGSSCNKRRKVWIFSGGQSERLARVRLRVLLPSRQPSRRRMAGRGVAVGDGLDVHGSYYAHINKAVKENNVNYMGTFPQYKIYPSLKQIKNLTQNLG